jgi:broad specificity phosphatase PhoE
LAVDRRPLLAFLTLLAAGACAHRASATETPLLRIFLARHGQTDWNAERRLQGQSDTHLNATGRAQAEKLAERLAGVRLDRVYSSTLSRTRETAEIVRGGVPLEGLDGLRERGLGKFEGIKLDGSEPAAAAEWEKRSHDPADTLDGGESDNEHFARVSAAIDQIRSRHPDGSILVVGHGGTNRMILRSLLDLPADQAEKIQQANDELYLIELAPGRPPRLWKNVTDANLADL